MIHELKTWPQYYDAVVVGSKPFEVRKDDRNYQSGDFLHLRKFDPKTESYSGEECLCKVTYILRGGSFGVAEGFCVMGIKRLA